MKPPTMPATPFTLSTPRCPVCGIEGGYRYRGLRDHLYGVDGTWDFRACPADDCGALWLDPAPTAALLPALYRGYYTHSDAPVSVSPVRRLYERARRAYLCRRYGYPVETPGVLDRIAGHIIGWLPARRDYFDLAAYYTRYVPQGHLLEIGCGSGAQLAALTALGWEATGLDFDPDAVAAARAKGLRVVAGTLNEAGFPDGSFDVVAMVHVLEHLIDPLSVLKECRRILKPGGTLFLATPNAASFAARHFGPDWRGLEPPRHIQVFTPHAMRRMLRDAGFGPQRIFTTQRDARNILRKSDAIRRARSGKDGRSPLFDFFAPALEALGRIACRFQPLRGEELCTIATRVADTSIDHV